MLLQFWALQQLRAPHIGWDEVQRIGAQAITGAFSTVSLPIDESEASLLPAQARLRQQELNTWIKWHTKPPVHRSWKAKRAINLANKTWIFPLQKTALRFSALNMSNLESIEAYPKPPWIPPATVTISEKTKAIELATNVTATSLLHSPIAQPEII